jgi:septum formation protein
VEVKVQPSAIDDATLRRGRVSPAQWVMALACLKARSVLDELRRRGIREGRVLAADTVCVCDDAIFGQPEDARAAGAMLRALRGRDHETMTGVCVMSLATGGRWTIVDRATVRVGFIDDGEIDRYVEAQEWRGKAGGYNLFDRVHAGWPLECHGDPATVVGLPMQRIRPWLDRVRGGAA